jgi:hypothetical protein
VSIELDAAGSPPRTLARRAARLVTEVFAPAVWAAVMPMVIAVHAASGVPAGLAWGAFSAVFSSVIPYGIIWLGVRRGQLTDHHIGQREQRRRPLLLGLACVLVGITALVVLRAPRELIAMVVVMFVVGLGATLVNHYWKLSIHAAVAAGSVAVLVLVFGPGLLPGILLVALVGWSRVVLRDHTTAQVLAGTLAGAVLAAPTFALIG